MSIWETGNLPAGLMRVGTVDRRIDSAGSKIRASLPISPSNFTVLGAHPARLATTLALPLMILCTCKSGDQHHNVSVAPSFFDAVSTPPSFDQAQDDGVETVS